MQASPTFALPNQDTVGGGLFSRFSADRGANTPNEDQSSNLMSSAARYAVPAALAVAVLLIVRAS